MNVKGHYLFALFNDLLCISRPMRPVLLHGCLFFKYIKQIMNVFHTFNGAIIFIRWQIEHFIARLSFFFCPKYAVARCMPCLSAELRECVKEIHYAHAVCKPCISPQFPVLTTKWIWLYMVNFVLLKKISLAVNTKQIMNAFFICAMEQIFSWGERWNIPFNLASPRLKEHFIFHLMKIFVSLHS